MWAFLRSYFIQFSLLALSFIAQKKKKREKQKPQKEFFINENTVYEI